MAAAKWVDLGGTLVNRGMEPLALVPVAGTVGPDGAASDTTRVYFENGATLDLPVSVADAQAAFSKGSSGSAGKRGGSGSKG